MNTYKIRDAFDTGYGCSISFNKAYENDIEFQAENHAEAFEYTQKLQAEHDEIYIKAGATQNDLDNSPCYGNHLYFVVDEENDVEVLLDETDCR